MICVWPTLLEKSTEFYCYRMHILSDYSWQGKYFTDLLPLVEKVRLSENVNKHKLNYELFAMATTWFRLSFTQNQDICAKMIKLTLDLTFCTFKLIHSVFYLIPNSHLSLRVSFKLLTNMSKKFVIIFFSIRDVPSS